ncbi:1-acyl-sn-glycerol-3-phosphate acyltransferase [Litoribacter ruber]|uniref:1-acyl-sn-glycerol-3-phosphate acyltransferase n=1 Tax=Litoribacter ruber TaxID=702568 RepID=A0AAP2CIL3_9BACT|nr:MULTISPECIES: 1-acyl-sn-glycerol-3-phosphate acyltransferase [Litoribacter]MBS9524852.1 1-acyl-sn-glycerol-3-phosphate acyltransferase [Litoribacter alkaliphilus]MBT0812565.1 1-acyl-sn-glycerol-3-phosphate acyltransferase [Litoribacter ruber]
MSKFDHIRPYYDTEVNAALHEFAHDPMMKAIMNFTFPGMEDQEWVDRLKRTHSIRDFQINFIYPALNMVLEKSSQGLTTSGFDKLDGHTAYLFISNHRDIILDTSLLNYSLYNHNMMMTTSAIGDNLVKKPFLMAMSRLTRNFIVQRGLPARELLLSSKLLSEYINNSLFHENRSVWMAQREGRTKDGNDATHKGVLKMLGMARGDMSEMEYFKKMKIVPVSISYEYDPTDALKMPELLARSRAEKYVKEKNEDFINVLTGIMGQKKRIHFHTGDVLQDEIDEIIEQHASPNKQIQALCDAIDASIISNYKLWPTNYIAHDLLHESDQFADNYTADEKKEFVERMTKGIKVDNPEIVRNFLSMYANPVINKMAPLVHKE